MSPSLSERGYARPELLADTEWLAGQIDNLRNRFVDAESEKDDAAEHLAGGVLLDGFATFAPLGGIRPRVEDSDEPSRIDLTACSWVISTAPASSSMERSLAAPGSMTRWRPPRAKRTHVWPLVVSRSWAALPRRGPPDA